MGETRDPCDQPGRQAAEHPARSAFDGFVGVEDAVPAEGPPDGRSRRICDSQDDDASKGRCQIRHWVSRRYLRYAGKPYLHKPHSKPIS
jgi:hypothetical protein